MASATPHEPPPEAPNKAPDEAPNEAADQQYRLGIDFGTSHTTAILRWPDGHTRPILFDGSPLLPSAVYADSDGQLLVGRDAIHAARLDPARFEATPKRHVGMSNDEDVTAMVAAVLGRVRDEAERVSGTSIGGIGVTLTYPAGWGEDRVSILREAGVKARLPRARLVEEPVAAAGYYAAVLGRSIAAGSALVVYDFGGGTFDASVVAPCEGGYEVLALAGLDDVGGVDLDAALLRHVADKHRSDDPQAWQRLEDPKTPADRRHRRHLIEDVRAAKEMLSRAESATVPVPLLELEARITRDEFDVLARPFLDRTVATTGEVIAAAGTPVAAVLLVGGSSRIPLVRELLEQATGVQPSTIDQPETVVAEGSLRLADGASGDTRVSASLPLVPVDLPSQNSPANNDDTASNNANNANTNNDAVNNNAVANADATTRAVLANPSLVAPVDPWDTGERVTSRVPLMPPPLAPQTPLPSIPRQPPPSIPRQSAQSPPARYVPPTRAAHIPQPNRPPQTPPIAYRHYLRRTSRRPTVLLTVLGLLAIVAAGAIIASPYLNLPFNTAHGPGDNGGTGNTAGATTPAGDPTTNGQTTKGQTTPSPSANPVAPYVRSNPPTWLPAGWKSLADDAKTPTVVAGVATNDGSCDYVGVGVLHVTRHSFNVSGCNMTPEVKANVVRDVAVEAEFAAVSGCGGMWVRTGARGYFVDVCADGTVELHELGDDPPSDASLRGGPWMAANPRKVVIGLVAQQAGLMVVIDGQPQPIIINEAIGSGRIGVGGFAPGDSVDATITRFRAWTPTGSGG